MSLLDNGPHYIDIYPQVEVVDSQGNNQYIPSETPVTVRCSVQPVSVTGIQGIFLGEADVLGQDTNTVYRVITRSAPAGPWARVEWDGLQWDIIGDMREYGMSPNTKHIDFVMRKRAPGKVGV